MGPFSPAARERGSAVGLRAVVLAALTLLVAPSYAGAETQDAGERAYQKCYSCHSVDPKETHLSGPNLAGVIGRRAASLAGFDYSPAMKKAGAEGLVWTEAALDRYVADPLEEIPGTTMSFPGLRSAAERRAVIDYLRRFR